jgi:hypothetical protein
MARVAQAQLSVAAQAGGVDLVRLAACVARLDAGTRALLDLSVRRGVRDDQMAPILRTDPFHLAWRRARALDDLAREVVDSGETPAPLGEVRMALEALPRQAWGLPAAQPALPAPSGVALVPAEPPGRLSRLDSFASESPRLRDAFSDLGRAVAAKLVRLVVWRRSS